MVVSHVSQGWPVSFAWLETKYYISFHFRCIQGKSGGILSILQGAKKIIFTACHLGKLKLAFTSPDVIFVNSSKNITCPSGKLKTELTSPIAKLTSPGLSDTTFIACCIR